MLLSKQSKAEFIIAEMEALFKRVKLDDMDLYHTIKFTKINTGIIKLSHRVKEIGEINYLKEIKHLGIDIYQYENGVVSGLYSEGFDEYDKPFNTLDDQKVAYAVIHNLMLAAIEVVMANRDEIDLGSIEN